VVFDKAGNETDEIALQFTANSSRPLTPIEMAPKVKRLHDLKLDNQAIAKKIGKSPSMVSYLLSLSAAPEEVKTMVKEKSITATMAVDAIRKDPAKAPQNLRDAVDRAKEDGKGRATRKYTLKKSDNGVVGVKSIVSGWDKQTFEDFYDWVVDEMDRRSRKAV
jgi:ParB-like chromosome segregation protein Spo0J